MLWESRAKEISRQRSRWTGSKKACEEKLSRDDHIRKVLDWIEKADDPQPTLRTIKRRVMPENRYQDAGRWFLDGDEFTAWRNTFQNSGAGSGNKRVLWVKGPYGTGKTTLLYVYNTLREVLSNCLFLVTTHTLHWIAYQSTTLGAAIGVLYNISVTLRIQRNRGRQVKQSYAH